MAANLQISRIQTTALTDPELQGLGACWEIGLAHADPT